MRPEQPARVTRTVAHLRTVHPAWEWKTPGPIDDSVLLTAHSASLIKRISHGPAIDDDTPHFVGIEQHARCAVSAAMDAAATALAGRQAFTLMRPPGHHCTRNHPMGFCYLNQIAIAALTAQGDRALRVAVWDFDAHHGNGTEDILEGRPGFFFSSVHQFPGYPGTGTRSTVNCRNYPVAPNTPRDAHMETLARSWESVESFQPDLILVSAGFDAYVHDPITSLSLELEDFAELGRWLQRSSAPVAAVLEGGYSDDLPLLVDAFLSSWEKKNPISAA